MRIFHRVLAIDGVPVNREKISLAPELHSYKDFVKMPGVIYLTRINSDF